MGHGLQWSALRPGYAWIKLVHTKRCPTTSKGRMFITVMNGRIQRQGEKLSQKGGRDAIIVQMYNLSLKLFLVWHSFLNSTKSDESICVKNERREQESLNPAYLLTSVLREMGLLVRFGFVKFQKLSDTAPSVPMSKWCGGRGFPTLFDNLKTISFEAYWCLYCSVEVQMLF